MVGADSPERPWERRGGHRAANRVSVDAMKSSLVRPSSTRRPCAPAAQNPIRCSNSCSTHPLQWLKSVIGSGRSQPGFDLLQYSQHARLVEGLVARLGRGGSSPLQRMPRNPLHWAGFGVSEVVTGLAARGSWKVTVKGVRHDGVVVIPAPPGPRRHRPSAAGRPSADPSRSEHGNPSAPSPSWSA
jgi:hypothetical protein